MKNNLSQFSIQKSVKRCLKYRKRILDISQKVSALHIGGAFSALEIVDCIYFGLMKLKINNLERDTFLMSKGHGCIAQYVVLESKGILKKKDIDLYCKPEGFLGAHPDYGNPGIEASTGSLGHGMGLSVGIAHTDKFRGQKNKIFVLISDGELQEGSTWETMMMAANLNLDNLVCFLDHNGSQSFGSTKETHPKFYPIKEKIESFGWVCKEVNGHNVEEIYKNVTYQNNGKPLFIICNTVKGKGVSYMENRPIWHYRSPTVSEYKIAIKELKEIRS